MRDSYLNLHLFARIATFRILIIEKKFHNSTILILFDIQVSCTESSPIILAGKNPLFFIGTNLITWTQNSKICTNDAHFFQGILILWQCIGFLFDVTMQIDILIIGEQFLGYVLILRFLMIFSIIKPNVIVIMFLFLVLGMVWVIKILIINIVFQYLIDLLIKLLVLFSNRLIIIRVVIIIIIGHALLIAIIRYILIAVYLIVLNPLKISLSLFLLLFVLSSHIFYVIEYIISYTLNIKKHFKTIL